MRRNSLGMGWLGGDYYTPGATVQRTRRRRPGIGPADLAVTSPPPGSFDPQLEYERLKQQRLLTDLGADTERADRLAINDQHTQIGNLRRSRLRSVQDTRRSATRGRFDIGQSLGRGLEDVGRQRAGIETNFARDMFDLSQANQRGGEDAARAIANLQRRYGTMAEAQTEAAAAGGVSTTRGGFAAASAAKRAANQAVEQQPIDTARARQSADIATRGTRLGEDRSQALANLFTSEGRLREDSALASGRLGADVGRSLTRTRQDYRTNAGQIRRTTARDMRTRALELSRATREQDIFDVAQTQEEYFAANQANPHIHFPSVDEIRAGVDEHGRPLGTPRRRRRR